MDLDGVRRQLRATARHSSETWQAVYRDALKRAYQQGQFEEIAEVAVLAAGRLEVQGRFDECLAHLDYAIELSATDRASLVHLLSVKAVFLAMAGQLEAARRLLDEASIGQLRSRKARLERETHRAIVRCLSLEEAPIGEMTAPIARSERAGMDWLGSSLKSWLVPWLAASGLRADALAWTDVLHAQALATGHQWRAEDAVAFRMALESATGSATVEPAEGITNRNAVFRQAATETWIATINANAERAALAAEQADLTLGLMPPDCARLSGVFSAFVKTHLYDEPWLPLAPPDTCTLLNLPIVLAASEAAAVGSSQARAASWLECMRRMPNGITTALDWPTSVDRVRGLLLLRVGADQQALAALGRAVRWADSATHPFEAGLARVQLAEAIALTGNRQAAHRYEGLRRGGRERLRERGVDPRRAAYFVAQAIGLGRTSRVEPKLTAREVEVLAALADGLTYREAAIRLGIEWRTVRAHAHHIYSKLDASGKVRAIAAARRLQIL